MDLLRDFPLQDGETETRDMRSREQREVASARQMATRYTVLIIHTVLGFFLEVFFKPAKKSQIRYSPTSGQKHKI